MWTHTIDYRIAPPGSGVVNGGFESGTANWTITGGEKGSDTYEVRVADGKCETSSQVSTNTPRLAITVTPVDFVKVVSGNVLGETRTTTLVVEEKYLNFDQSGAYATSFVLAAASVLCIVGTAVLGGAGRFGMAEVWEGVDDVLTVPLAPEPRPRLANPLASARKSATGAARP